jgi:hypothetical protein
VTLVQTYNYFLRAALETSWGSGSNGVNEVQTVTISDTTGGTFTLTFGAATTAAIAWNARATAVQAALELLATIGRGNVIVTGADGGPYTVTFINRLGGTDVAQLTSSAVSLTGGTPAIAHATTTAGVAGKSFMGVRAKPWSFVNIPTRAFPEGERVGTRDIDSQPSVAGRRHGQGDIPMWTRPDVMGLFMLAALGSETVAASPGTAAVRKAHTIRCADLPPSLTLQDFYGAVVSAADKAYEYKGVSIDTLRIAFDATDDQGLLDMTVGAIGNFGSLITKPPRQFSDYLPQATWNCIIKRNGVASADVQAFTGEFANNVVRVKAGVGSQDDQDRQFGGRTFRGTMTLLYHDETEYNLFLAAGEESVEIVFTDSYLLETVSATPYYGGLRIWIPRFTYETYRTLDVDGYKAQEIGFRAYRDESIGGPVEFDVYNNVPAY